MVDISHAFKTAKITMIDPKICVSLSKKPLKTSKFQILGFLHFKIQTLDSQLQAYSRE